MDLRQAAEAIHGGGDVRSVLADRLITGNDAAPEALTALGLLYVGDELAKRNASDARAIVTAAADYLEQRLGRDVGFGEVDGYGMAIEHLRGFGA